MRDVTTLPLGRPGSELNTQRACRPTRSITGRDDGEAISSSLVMRPASGAGAPPKRLKAASTKALSTRPALHVDHAGAIGAAALDAERTARHLALGEHGVAMAHQHDRALVGRLVVEADVDGVAEALVGLDGR